MSTHILPEYGFATNTRIKAQVRAILASETAPPRVYMRAFAPKGTRLTVQGLDARDCKVRLVALCRDYHLPVRRTLATARVIRNPSARRFVR